jgi:4'-phosphopantetheinyl transferase
MPAADRAWPWDRPDGALPDDEVHVWLVPLDAKPDEVAHLLPLLSPDERERTTRFRLPEHGARFAVARAALRLLLAAHVGQAPADLRFEYGPRGKPTLTGAAAGDLEFNLSHSRGEALYGVSQGRTVGIDLESVRPGIDVEALSRRFLAPEERESLSRLTGAARLEGFFRCWTRKEALLKALGEGLAVPLSSFAVSCAPGEEARILRGPEGLGGADRWRLRDLDPGPEHAAAVCVEGADWSLRCRRWRPGRA